MFFSPLTGAARLVGGALLNAVQQYTKSQYSHIVVLTDAATVNYVAEDSNIFKLVADNTGTRKLANPTEMVAGMTWQVWFWQDSTNGLEALTFGTWYDWGDLGIPDFTAQTANKKNIITCVALSATQIFAVATTGAA